MKCHEFHLMYYDMSHEICHDMFQSYIMIYNSTVNLFNYIWYPIKQIRYPFNINRNKYNVNSSYF
jgi:hypothetical protein